MADTVHDFFTSLPLDWEFPNEGVLFKGPRGVYIITAARRMNSWNDLRDSLGSVRWELSIVDPEGCVEIIPIHVISTSRWTMVDNSYSSQYG